MCNSGKRKQKLREQTPTFILELPLAPDPKQAHILRSRFEAARNLYNTLLGEALARQKKMFNSPEWIAAKALPQKDKKKRRLQRRLDRQRRANNPQNYDEKKRIKKG